MLLNGDYHAPLEDINEPLLASFGEKIAAGTAQPADMTASVGKTLQLVTSVTFGDPICAPFSWDRWRCPICRPAAHPFQDSLCVIGSKG